MSFATYTSLTTGSAAAPATLADEHQGRLPPHQSVLLVLVLSAALWVGIGSAVYWLVG